MLRIINTVLMGIFILLWGSLAFPQSVELHGQLSGWMTAHPDNSFDLSMGLRYIPTFSAEKKIFGAYLLDSEISVNAYGTGLVDPFTHMETHSKIKPYRVWLRFSSTQFEVRLGLQKINFGSATLLRPLMWFDRVDPRDPLGLTDGVYGLLGRYYFLNNANVWLWGLYGNDEVRGWEVLPPHKHEIEYGGRLQVPLYNGEIAATYHHRRADILDRTSQGFLSSKNSIPENRFALDGKWDLGVGLWFEGVLIHQDVHALQLRYRRLVNIGFDYTFDLGNGLNLIVEYFRYENSDRPFGSGDGISFSASALNYPVGLMDNLTALLYYDWENHEWYRHVNWERKYDNWSLYFIGFWNPDQLRIDQGGQGNELHVGKGLQMMIVLNH